MKGHGLFNKTYQFLLLDRVTGRRWYVQWGFESSNRWIIENRTDTNIDNETWGEAIPNIIQQDLI